MIHLRLSILRRSMVRFTLTVTVDLFTYSRVNDFKFSTFHARTGKWTISTQARQLAWPTLSLAYLNICPYGQSR